MPKTCCLRCIDSVASCALFLFSPWLHDDIDNVVDHPIFGTTRIMWLASSMVSELGWHWRTIEALEKVEFLWLTNPCCVKPSKALWKAPLVCKISYVNPCSMIWIYGSLKGSQKFMWERPSTGLYYLLYVSGLKFWGLRSWLKFSI